MIPGLPYMFQTYLSFPNPQKARNKEGQSCQILMQFNLDTHGISFLIYTILKLHKNCLEKPLLYRYVLCNCFYKVLQYHILDVIILANVYTSDCNIYRETCKVFGLSSA